MKKTSLSPISLTVITIVLFSATTMVGGVAAGAGSVASSPGDVSSASSLDGKTFVARTGEKGKQASNKDTIVFRNGRFFSEGCKPYGFGDAPYQATVDGVTVRFHAETHSPTHGTMVWDGIIRGDSIEATSTWTRERWYWNIKREYWYKGQLKK